MASVKQEESTTDSDSWLKYWANNPQLEKIKQESCSEHDDKDGIMENGSIAIIAKVENIEKAEVSDSNDLGKVKSGPHGKDNVRSGKNERKRKRNANKNNCNAVANGKIKATTKGQTKSQARRLDAQFENTLKTAKISQKIANLCEYQCPICSETCTSRVSLCNHFRETKHVVLSRKGNITPNRYLTKIVAYICLLCDEKLLCDKKILHKHMNNCHKIHLMQYITKNNVEYEERQAKPQQNFDEMCPKLSQSKQLSKYLGNFCKFKCTKCNYCSPSWRLMRDHKSAFKHEQEKQSISHTINHVTKLTLHKCNICHELVICDNDIFKSHLRKHKLPISKYKRMHQNSSVNDLLFVQYLKELKSAIKHIPIVSFKPTWSLNGFHEDSQTTGDLGNISFFKCPYCERTDMSYAALFKHCKTKHPSNLCTRFIENGKELRYHKCHICSKGVICDNALISSHLKNVHKTNLSKYISEYVLKNGFKVYPTFKDYQLNSEIFESVNPVDKEVKSHDDDDNGLILPSMLSSESEDSDQE